MSTDRSIDHADRGQKPPAALPRATGWSGLARPMAGDGEDVSSREPGDADRRLTLAGPDAEGRRRVEVPSADAQAT
jgi:hypothetical protein